MKNLIYTSVLLLIISVTLSAPALAQEKQSDATWEETVEFIKKYRDYIIDDPNSRRKNRLVRKQEFNLTNCKNISTCEFIYERTLTYRGETERHYSKERAPLKYLHEIKYYEKSDGYGLIFTESVLKIYNEKGKRIGGGSAFFLGFRGIEMRPRLLKAFQHLAYLATEYREEQRKASGDTF